MPERIMVVDDEELVWTAMRDLLKSAGYSVSTASNGQEALVELSRGEHPDLMVIDFMMPGMSGLELCKIIRADVQLQGIKIVILTAVVFRPKGSEAFKEIGVTDFIPKPCDTHELLARVESIMARS